MQEGKRYWEYLSKPVDYFATCSHDFRNITWNERHKIASIVANITITSQLSPSVHSEMAIVSTIACPIIITRAFIVQYTDNRGQLFCDRGKYEKKRKNPTLSTQFGIIMSIQTKF